MPTFSPPTNFGVTNLVAAVIADLDGDGHNDIVFASDTEIQLKRGTDGLGNFGPITTLATTASTGLALADTDNNGRLDLISWNRVTKTVRIQRHSNTPLTFLTAQPFTLADDVIDVKVANLNNDARADLVVWTTGGRLRSSRARRRPAPTMPAPA